MAATDCLILLIGEKQMKRSVLLIALLALAASVKAGPMSDLECASAAIGADKNSIAVPQAPVPTAVEPGNNTSDKSFIDDILDQIPFKRTYRLGPLFSIEANSALPTVVRNFENAGAKIQESRVEGGWRDSYVVVVYKARFKVKQYRRGNFQDPLYLYLKLDQIMRELQRQEVHVIYKRIEGLPGNFSIVIDYAGNKQNVPQMIDNVIDGNTDAAGR